MPSDPYQYAYKRALEQTVNLADELIKLAEDALENPQNREAALNEIALGLGDLVALRALLTQLEIKETP